MSLYNIRSYNQVSKKSESPPWMVLVFILATISLVQTLINQRWSYWPLVLPNANQTHITKWSSQTAIWIMLLPCLKFSRASYCLQRALMPHQSLKGTALSGSLSCCSLVSGHFLCCMPIASCTSLLTCSSQVYHLVTYISVPFTSCSCFLGYFFSPSHATKPRRLLPILQYSAQVEPVSEFQAVSWSPLHPSLHHLPCTSYKGLLLHSTLH